MSYAARRRRGRGRKCCAFCPPPPYITGVHEYSIRKVSPRTGGGGLSTCCRLTCNALVSIVPARDRFVADGFTRPSTFVSRRHHRKLFTSAATTIFNIHTATTISICTQKCIHRTKPSVFEALCAWRICRIVNKMSGKRQLGAHNPAISVGTPPIYLCHTFPEFIQQSMPKTSSLRFLYDCTLRGG